ncbi:glycosyl hydrolase family 28 protein [Robinsoniella sp. KNHs210]|uniref:glycosyl hydrolase family 28 protein n=1 Tax=Robinsoniella sp. KNHs210 TaxID=1469950 RepID=UPI0004888600|nr:glycosyl hydrolase family 28 protein [Robinsoniella sp. KNHs210]
MFKRRVCATVLSLAVIVSSTPGITVAATDSTTELGDLTAARAATSVIDEAPPVPSITRYSTSSWDASWFRTETNLQKGTCIYTIDPDPTKSDVTNYAESDYEIQDMPDKFIGCDYILNRIKNQPSRDHHFYAEQDIEIYAAIDTAQSSVPSSLAGFTKTDGTLKLNNGNEFWLAKRSYPAGLVTMNKYNGSGNNVFYMVLPQNGEAVSNALTHNAVVEEGEKPAQNLADQNYRYYLNDVFNFDESEDVPAGYTGSNVLLSQLGSGGETKFYSESDNMAFGASYKVNHAGNTNASVVDGNIDTYWQSQPIGDEFPAAELTIDLQALCKVNKVTLKLRKKGISTWAPRTQEFEVQVSTDGKNFTTVKEKTEYLFDPADAPTGNESTNTITFDETKARYVRLVGYSNTLEKNAIQLSEMEIYGPEQTVTIIDDAENLNRYPIIEADGELVKTFDEAITGKVVYEGKVRSSTDDTAMSIPVMKSADGKTAVELTFGTDGYIRAGDEEVMAYTRDTWYIIKMLVDIDKGTYEVWVDHMRKVQNAPFSDSDAKNIKTITWSSGSGILQVDNLLMHDDTEIFAVEDNFNSEATGTANPENWTVSNVTYAAVSEVPFASDKSLQIENRDSKVEATRSFGALTGDVTIEAKVKPMENTWVTVPVVRDSKGNDVIKVAAYRNSFFISNGENWEYICSQEIANNYYPAGNWYQIKLVLNTYTNRYDFYIDGAKRCSRAAFVSDADDVASVSYVVEEQNVLYVDNVRVYDSASLARGLKAGEIFDVKDYGAVGDGITDDTEAIDEAIRAAAYTGGTVLLENGTFYCGQITMQSDMTLFIDASAKIFAKMDRNEYIHFQPKYNGIVGYNGNHQLGCGIIRSIEGTENFRINGGGTLDGNGFYGFNENDPGNQRPCALYLTSSNDFHVENINIINSPHWTLVPYESTNMTFRNIAITNHIAPNRDGIDPVNCSNITIENCHIIAGDDAFCPKSGNAFPSINCDMRNTSLQSYCNGIKFGTDSYDDFKNYTCEDIVIKNVGMSGITLQAVDGSEIENITFKRIDMIDVDNSIAFMVGDRQRANSGLEKHLGFINNVVVEDMNFSNAMEPPFSHKNEIEHASMLVGLNPSRGNTDVNKHRITNVLFKNVYMEMPGGYTSVPGLPGGIGSGYPEHDGMGDPVGWAYTMRWADNVTLENCQNVLMTKDVRKEYSYSDYSGAKMEDGNANKILYGIVFENGENVLENPVLSGVIGYGESATALNYSLIQSLKSENSLSIDKDIYEGAIVKCDASGNLKLYDATGTQELAIPVAEKFANEDGERLVFHIAGEIDEAAVIQKDLESVLKKAKTYEDKEDYYTANSWKSFSDAYAAAKNAANASLEEKKDAVAKLKSAMEGLARPTGVKIEVETGELSGGASISSAAACSGGQRVGNIGGTSKGAAAFKVAADEAGEYIVAIVHCTSASRLLAVQVNGTENSVNCPVTGGWDVPAAKPIEVKVNLDKGINTIVLTGVGIEYGPNVDYIEVRKAGGVDPEITAAKEALAAVITSTELLEEADYTTESWAVLKAAVNAGRAVAADVNATKQELNDAIAAIEAAAEALVAVKPEVVVDRKALKDAIAQANAISAEALKQYTDESVRTFKNALAAAAGLSEKASQKEVDAAAAALQAAMKGLVKKPVTPPVVQKEISKLSIGSIKAQTHTGSSLKPIISIKDGSKVLKQDVDYTVYYKNNKNPGTAQIIITGKGTYKGSLTKTFVILAKKGRTYTVGNYKYKVLSASTKSGTVSLTKPVKNTLKTVKVPDTVKIGNYRYKVTEIGKSAFKRNNKLKTVTIGKNVKKIGTAAFYNDKALKKITIYSKVIKSVGKNALKGIHARAAIKVPKSKLKSYQSRFAKKGQKNTVVIKK